MCSDAKYRVLLYYVVYLCILSRYFAVWYRAWYHYLCHVNCCCIWLLVFILSFPCLQMSLAEYKKRQRKLKPKISEPERRAPSSAITKAAVPSPSKKLINLPPPVSVKQSTASGYLHLFLFFSRLYCSHVIVHHTVCSSVRPSVCDKVYCG